jgi:uncharacterized membrane protein YvbJ
MKAENEVLVQQLDDELQLAINTDNVDEVKRLVSQIGDNSVLDDEEKATLMDEGLVYLQDELGYHNEDVVTFIGELKVKHPFLNDPAMTLH